MRVLNLPVSLPPGKAIYRPRPARQIVFLDNGVDLARPDMGMVPYGGLQAVGACRTEIQGMELAAALLFVHGIRQPFLVAGNKVQQVTDGPPENPETRVRHGLTYLGHRVPQIIIDSVSYAFLFGRGPIWEANNRSASTRVDALATAIAQPLQAMAPPPPPPPPAVAPAASQAPAAGMLPAGNVAASAPNAGYPAVAASPLAASPVAASPAAGASSAMPQAASVPSYAATTPGYAASTPGYAPSTPAYATPGYAASTPAQAAGYGVGSPAHGDQSSLGANPFAPDPVPGGQAHAAGGETYGATDGSEAIEVSGSSYKGLWNDSQIASIVYFDGESLIVRGASEADEGDVFWNAETLGKLGQSLRRGEDAQTVLRGEAKILPLTALRRFTRIKSEKELQIEYEPTPDVPAYDAIPILRIPYSVPSEGDALFRTCSRCLRDGWKAESRINHEPQDASGYYNFLWGVLGLTALMFVISLFASADSALESRSYSRRGRQARAVTWIAAKLGPQNILMIGGAISAITFLLARAAGGHKEEVDELVPKPAAGPGPTPAMEGSTAHVGEGGGGNAFGARPPP